MLRPIDQNICPFDDKIVSPDRMAKWLTYVSVQTKEPKTAVQRVQEGRVKKVKGGRAERRRPKDRKWLLRFFSKDTTEETGDEEDLADSVPDNVDIQSMSHQICGNVEAASAASGVMNNAIDEHTQEQTVAGDWTDEEIALFNKLNNRGLEPLFPDNWKMDFETVPEDLFSGDDSEVLINNLANDGHFRGKVKVLPQV